jgi:hypothetical protein
MVLMVVGSGEFASCERPVPVYVESRLSPATDIDDERESSRVEKGRQRFGQGH